ncbi:hypothetical protein [Rossellomorea marisflavi]|uniref:hypothetical protein n=1 Tax=Rossellomorea marisflavi TaxID=189381 RepID=UPI00345CD6E3
MKMFRQIIITWTVCIAFLTAVSALPMILQYLGGLSIMIHPIIGPIILTVLIMSSLFPLMSIQSQDEKNSENN